MSENSTSSPWLLPFPSGVGRVNLGATDFQELAERCTTIFGEKFLLVKTSAVETGVTAKAGELVVMTGLAGTVNLPKAAAANTIIGMFALGGEMILKTTGGEHIIGRGEGSSETSIVVSINQYVIVTYDGTHWLIVGGVPNEYVGKAQIRVESITDSKVVKGRALVETENAYTAEEVSGPHTFTPSITRPAIVIINVHVGGTEGDVECAGANLSVNTVYPTTIWVPPGKVVTLKGGHIYNYVQILL